MFYDSPVPVMLGLILLAAWGFWLLFRRHQVTSQIVAQRTEVFSRLLERFTSASEFITFIQSEQGQKLFDVTPARKSSRPFWTVIRTIQLATVMIFLSFIFFLDAFVLRGGTDINDAMARDESLHFGLFLSALGLGLLAAAGLGMYFARRWGMLEREPADRAITRQ